ALGCGEERHAKMLGNIWPAEPFQRAVAIFFALVLFTLAIATLVNAPLSFDGAVYLFDVLDTHHFAAAHGRIINIPLQLPVMAAAHLTQNIAVLRLIFSAAYASVPLLGLAASWIVC